MTPRGARQDHPGTAALRGWADRLADAYGAGTTAYVFFNNDPGGAAIVDAVAMAGALRRAGLPSGRAVAD